MSVRVMTQVWEIDLPASQKIVLLALADCANDDGHCWPGMATLAAKCSKSERTVQGMIAQLEKDGHLSRNQVPGKGCNYYIHPRKSCTPAETAPRKNCAKPPQNLRHTPAKSAPKPSKNHQEPSKTKNALPANWHPLEFSTGSKCREIIDGWPPGELEMQIEHFTAHHRANGNKFNDWQDAWKTWVINSRKFNRHGNRKQSSSTATAAQGALAILEARNAAGSH